MQELDVVHVAIPSDANYVCGLLVTAASIAIFADKKTPLEIHVLDGGIPVQDLQRVSDAVARFHPQIRFSRVVVDEKIFDGFPLHCGNTMTYARLLLAEALPDVDFIIYTDSDMLWMRDITELWRLRRADVPFMSTVELDPHTQERERGWFEKNGYAFKPDRYFCGGLSFYNLKWFRDHRFLNRVKTFIGDNPTIQYADQTALNVLLQDDLWIVPSCWQRLSSSPGEDPDVVIHYAGDAPWKSLFGKRLLTDVALIWFAIDAKARNVMIKESLLRYYSSSRIRLGRWLYWASSFPVVRFAFLGMVFACGRWKRFETIKGHAHRVPWARKRLAELIK